MIVAFASGVDSVDRPAAKTRTQSTKKNNAVAGFGSKFPGALWVLLTCLHGFLAGLRMGDGGDRQRLGCQVALAAPPPLRDRAQGCNGGSIFLVNRRTVSRKIL